MAAKKTTKTKKKRAPKPELAETQDALTGVLTLLMAVRTLMKDESVEPKTVEKLMARESRLLGLQGQLEAKQEFLKDRIIGSHPDWTRTKTALLDALQPFPEASKAVINALQNLGV